MSDKIKRLHEIMLEEIKAMHYICEKHNLVYFANGGTCLGAIRHNGFIPWDDDVDIMLLRDDYDKFVEVAGNELENYSGSKYKMYGTTHNGVRGYRIATDVIDDILGTMTVEIDLMTYDKLPKSKLKQKIMRFRLASYRGMIKKKRKKMSFCKRIYSYLLRFIGFLKGEKGIIKSHDKLAIKYNKTSNKYNYYISTMDAHDIMMKKSYLCDWFKDRILVDFEDTKIYVPKKYDEYLKYEYGNYNELPPIEERIPAHNKLR